MKKTIASLCLLFILGTSTAMADMIPEGEKVIPACAKLVNASSFENTVFFAAIYSEAMLNGPTLPEEIVTITEDTCLNTGKYEFARYFAADKTERENKYATSYLTEIPDPTTDINNYPLSTLQDRESINTYDEYVDITNSATTMTREYLVLGFDNEKRTFSVGLVARTTDTYTEDLVPTTPPNLDDNLDITTPVFSDVALDKSYAVAIMTLKRAGVLQGYEDGSFKPDALINRAEFTKIVIASTYPETQDCALTTPTFTFTDVVMDSWYADFVCMAFTNDIIAGYPDDTFKPEQNINFVEAAKIIANNAKLDIDDTTDPWYSGYVLALTNANAVPLTIKALDQNITRSEMAEMMWRIQYKVTNLQSMQYDPQMNLLWSSTDNIMEQ